MALHVFAFLQCLRIDVCDVLRFSFGGMIAQKMVLDRPSIFNRMILVGTVPRGSAEIMHLNKPALTPFFADPTLKGYELLQKIFFASSVSSQLSRCRVHFAIGATVNRSGTCVGNSGCPSATTGIPGLGGTAWRTFQRIEEHFSPHIDR
jgi:pimeloyl-ACP methyl ester carboxylesterase